MDVGHGGGEQSARAPHFSKCRAKFPLSCNLVALLEHLEGAKINGKTHFSSDFRRLKYQNLPGEHAPDPLADLHLGTGAILTFFKYANCFFASLSVSSSKKCSISLSEAQPRCPSIYVPPTFIRRPKSLLIPLASLRKAGGALTSIALDVNCTSIRGVCSTV